MTRSASVASCPLWAKVGLAVSIGCIGGIGINTAHELGHKKESHERWLSKIALAQSFYGHFYIEHNRGHHVRVATPEDPASSRVGESFYQFWPRTVLGSLHERLAAGEAPLRPQAAAPVPDRQRRAQRLADVAGALGRAGRLAGRRRSLPYLVIQAVVGFSLLEVVNYMEHYGMLRQKVGVGERQRYERVDPTHSWNSNNIATNVLLYHLQRHSDHHANPTRRYQSLRDFEESPVLPTGYAGMIVLAIVPAVWRRVMDPRVLAHFDGDLSPGEPLARASGTGSWRRTRRRRRSSRLRGRRADRGARRPTAEVLAARCPGCGYTYDGRGRRRARGLRGRHAVGRRPGRLVLPRLRRPREGRLRPAGPAARPPGPSTRARDDASG